MITPEVAAIKAAVESEFADEFESAALRNWGVYNRRPIAGTTTWSQHAWGNAWDIGTIGGLALGDRVVRFLARERDAGRLKVGTILWRVRDHWDHIHVEGSPKKTGTPPKEGTTEMKELVANIQKALNAAGAKDRNGNALKVDGVWGPLTESAFVNGLTSGVGSGTVIKGSFSGKVT